VLDESVNSETLKINGNIVDLFDPQLRVKDKIELKPNENALLFDLDYDPPGQEVRMIAASSRVEKITQNDNGFEMLVKGPEKIIAAARLYCPKEPKEVDLVIGDEI